MSKQASKTTIGAFVLGAVALVVAGVMVFGSGKFFTETDKYVLYFEGSVKGLNVGAPVMFRGVKIGVITDIQLQFSVEDISVLIPVVIEVDPEKFKDINAPADYKEQRRSNQRVKVLIEHGLRAQLQLQSIVTGQLMVDFDFYPDEPAKFVGKDNVAYSEIPTISSGLQKLTKTIEQLPLDELFNKIVKTVEGIERLVNSPDVSGSFASLKKALDSADKLMVHVDRKIDPLLASIEDTSSAARGAFVQVEKTLALEEGVPGELAASLRGTLTSLRDTLASAGDALDQARETLASYEGVVAEDSDLLYEVITAMRELAAAARSIRYFADYIDRHPEALLKGKKQ